MGFSGRWGSYLGIKFSSSLDGAQKTTKNLASFQNKCSLLSFSKWIRMCFLSIEEKTFLSLWPTEPSDSLPPPPQEIKINYNVVYMRIIMRDIISTEEQTTSSVQTRKVEKGKVSTCPRNIRATAAATAKKERRREERAQWVTNRAFTWTIGQSDN